MIHENNLCVKFFVQVGCIVCQVHAIIPAMKNGERGPKKEFQHRESVRLTDEQKAHLIKKYGGVTAGIRRLIAADMEADGERKG